MSRHFEKPNFNPGAIQDKPDERDFRWEEIGFALPPFDWTKGYDVEQEIAVATGQPNFKLPVNDQDGSGSCGGQAWSKYAEVLKAIFRKSFDRRSAKFIYAQTFVPGGGSAGRDNSNVLIRQGCSNEALCPSYMNGQPADEAFYEQRVDITDDARNSAKFDEALSYANVPADIDSIAQATKANHGVIIGLRGSNNGTWGSYDPQPPKSGENAWGHWLYCGKARLVNGKKKIIFLNSWGADIGQGGWQEIGEEYFAVPNAVWLGWTLLFNPNPSSPGFAHNFATDISFNDVNDEVKALQTALQIDGEFPKAIAPTGFYGDITRRSVLAFQQKYQVATPQELAALNGRKAGPQTRSKLNQIFAQ